MESRYVKFSTAPLSAIAPLFRTAGLSGPYKALRSNRAITADSTRALHRIVVVGGGAAGLELAARLGRTLGRRGKAHIVLIDQSPTHLWKPLLHQVAAGIRDPHEDDVDYLSQARWQGFEFRVGRLQDIDRAAKTVRLAAHMGAEGLVLPERHLSYDTLVLALGSVSNDFGVPGVAEHCMFLDRREQAEAFQQRLLDAYLRVSHDKREPVRIAIVGAGATGVELAAALHDVTHRLAVYGFDISPERDLQVMLLDAQARILPTLSERMAAEAEKELRSLGVRIYTDTSVVKVNEAGLHLRDGRFLPAHMKLWCAGIKAPDFLAGFGLETSGLNQILVRPTLQTVSDDDVFALGDCAACSQPDGRKVPPTAQAASQQAATLAEGLARRVRGKALPEFVFRHRGTLLSFGRYRTVADFRGPLSGRFLIAGWLAKGAYRFLYRRHQSVLFGPLATALLTLSDLLVHRGRPHLKLNWRLGPGCSQAMKDASR